MTVRFILGPSGSGKTHSCVQELAALIDREPLGAPLLFLVPQQSTFIHEKRLAAACAGGGFCRAQVSGFSRLAARAARQYGAELPPALSEAGQLLMMSSCVAEHGAELTAFAAACRRAGFSRDMVSAAEELRTYGVEPQQLAQAAAELAQQQPNSHSAQRLQDIALLSGYYDQALSGRYSSYSERMAFLAQRIMEGMLDDCQVWLDGFSEFTPAELAVVRAMMARCPRVSLALNLDAADFDRPLRDDEVFYPSWQSYCQLNEAANAVGAVIEAPLRLTRHSHGRFAAAPQLAALERGLAGKPQPRAYVDDRAKTQTAPTCIHLSYGVDMRAELEQAGRTIHRLVRERGWHYRDISIICRDAKPYEYLLQPVLGGLDLPYFLDSHKPLLYHPLVELVRSALEVWAERPHYRQIMRYLKNPLAGLSRGEADELDNYCLAHGVRFYHWLTPADWHFAPLADEDEQLLPRIELIRRRGFDPLGRFLQGLAQPATATPQTATTSAACLNQALLTLLTELQAQSQLQTMQQQAVEQGRSLDAAAHAQAWDKLTAFLDEASRLLGETAYSADELRELYDAALGGLVYATIPPGLDQVLVASLERSRNPEIKAAFVLGLNEGLLPRRQPAEGAFRDEERQWLASRGIRLSPDTVRRQLGENYLAYVALTRASQELYLSYHLSDAEGKDLPPSPLLRRLQALFPGLKAQPPQLPSAHELCGAPADLELAAWGLRAQADNPLWEQVRQHFQAHGGYGAALRQLEQGLSFRALATPLRASTLRRLYGGNLRASVSRLERFRSCPFAYFATYGLRLRPRREYGLSAADRGDLFHYVLAEVGRSIAHQGLSWRELDEQLAATLVQAALDEYLPRFLSGIMSSSARYAYLAGRIKAALVAAVMLTAEHMRRGSFVPIAYELPFGRPEAPDGLPALSIPLDDGRQLLLSGQIDRVDMAESADGKVAWLRVIDYKTGSNEMRREDVEAGLQLQLLAYLQVVLGNAACFTARVPRAAGVYYAHVHDGLPLSEDGDDDLPGLKLAGFSEPDAEAVRLADATANGWSKLISARRTANAVSTGLQAGELDQLRRRVVELLKDSATAMLSGLVSVSPLQDGQRDACAYCDFASVCGFDRGCARPRRRRDALAPGQEGK